MPYLNRSAHSELINQTPPPTKTVPHKPTNSQSITRSSQSAASSSELRFFITIFYHELPATPANRWAFEGESRKGLLNDATAGKAFTKLRYANIGYAGAFEV